MKQEEEKEQERLWAAIERRTEGGLRRFLMRKGQTGFFPKLKKKALEGRSRLPRLSSPATGFHPISNPSLTRIMHETP